MTMNDLSTPMELLLSREEVFFVLDVLQTQFLPGLDQDPDGDLTKEERAIAVRTAGRALQARQLLQVRAGGEFALHNTLLRVLGVCAYSQGTVFVYHWPPGSPNPIRSFFHTRGNDGVIHVRHNSVIHRFTLVPAHEIAQRVLEACAFQPEESPGSVEVLVSNQGFLQARELAERGEVGAATQLFQQEGASLEQAQKIAKSLAGTTTISILQVVKQESASVRKRDITFVQNGVHRWMVEPMNGERADTLRIRTLEARALQEILGSAS